MKETPITDGCDSYCLPRFSLAAYKEGQECTSEFDYSYVETFRSAILKMFMVWDIGAIPRSPTGVPSMEGMTFDSSYFRLFVLLVSNLPVATCL